MEKEELPRWLNVKQAANYVGKGTAFIRNFIKKYKVPHLKINTIGIRIEREILDKYLIVVFGENYPQPETTPEDLKPLSEQFPKYAKRRTGNK